MHIRMSTWATRPGMDDESARLWSTGARDIFYRQPGLVQANILALPDSDQRMTFSVWESVEHHEQFVAGELQRAVRMFDDVFAPGGNPQAKLWQLLAGEWPAQR
jgi:heme-degrading monooxygenase HmoA